MITPGDSDSTQPRLVVPSAFAAGVKGNADVALTPQPSPGRDTVEFDFPGVLVGTAEYGEGPTGCTVIYIPEGARTSVDARGGAVGMCGGYERNHAICFVGGSVYGLGAVAGVADGLLERSNNRVWWEDLRLVSGAIIYDFLSRNNAIVPDAALGLAALLNAEEGKFPVGRCGAGRNASVGNFDSPRSEFAGQGAAFRSYGRVDILVGTVVNALGVVVDRSGRIVRGNYDRQNGQRRSLASDYERAALDKQQVTTASGNTTLTALVTNAKLTDVELNQLARLVHSSMYRAIQPFHTESDGDVLFALTTDEIELSTMNTTALGVLASEVAWDAVLSSVV